MVSYIVSRVIMLVFGTLYPAYSSYKAIKMKNVREYVRWMMYWIVFALFISLELFADLLLGFWFPFYYEIKIVFMLWLLLPATKGSSILYRKFVHPWLSRHEKDIDSYIAQAKESGYDTLLRVSKNSLTVAADTMMRTAASGQTVLAERLRQYGSDATDNKQRGRLHKAKSWYGGMHSPDNDYMPIDETEEYNLDEREDEEPEELEEPAGADVESSKLSDDVREDPEGTKSQRTMQSSSKSRSHRSSTLPRSYGKSSSRPKVHTSDYDHFETSTLPRTYETRNSGSTTERKIV